ncbi:Ribonuclease P protein subunit p20 [Wickerhamomyces ciferrii]|uniref:Ribonuclease P protein subunit p20 n=1 Tax=Wickerhamomyces ciferrii (strain ATCC 14091 / BCRC 22168 / CBS 111 / JCM 3599 / NBRC 0793 / NRRL Y-1031 F-60-10) TaxID=1206466 RepID=K0KGU4_WICCF|nr:Ribonuclease P protein subunit p20 [Wickerhamomyces ciferrii]CCH40624.1 Ribonuclease P protein subunit p20 [Wickerhamomyces ciferrii]
MIDIKRLQNIQIKLHKMIDNPTKQPRFEGKHIRHAPSKQFKYSDLETSVHIKSSTPYISAIKRINKLLNKLPKSQPKFKEITVLGMGATIEKTLSIGVYFQKDQGLKVDILTKSVDVLDEFDDEDLDHDTIYKKRKVTAVELRIHKEEEE